MNLHEYQAKMLLKGFNVPVLDGFLAYTPREAQKAAVDLGGGLCVVKAQVHAGGRGKGGGVKLAKNATEAFELASKILGMKLITPQTGAAGKIVRKVWIEAGANIDREFYLSFIVNRAEGCVSIITSREGGMEIEEVAATHPERVATINVSIESGLQDFHVRKMAAFLEIPQANVTALKQVIFALHRAFLELDCSLLEINPLLFTKEQKFICLDAKMAIDDNALYRQKKAHLMMDFDEIDERELRANEVGINYVALEGNIGCMVNGAGLAMATMDIIKQAGGQPANFLDVGGGATKEMVTQAFKLILQDSSVKGVLVNIFGGIMRCDVIAEGIISAATTLAIKVPLVVRLQGTNVDLGKELLQKSGLSLIAADDMTDAAKKIVSAVK